MLEQIGVRLGVHFASQDLFGAGYRERGDLVAQLLARARHLLLGLIDASFIIGVGLALWFATGNPLLARLG